MTISRNRFGLAALVVLSLVSPIRSWAACGTQAVCADTSTSLIGVIVLDSVTLTWSTTNENSSVASYKIKRYTCSTPSTCSVDVTTITPSGSCNQTKNYSYTDNPPTPVSQWTYTVEVWRSDESRACAVDVQPQ